MTKVKKVIEQVAREFRRSRGPKLRLGKKVRDIIKKRVQSRKIVSSDNEPPEETKTLRSPDLSPKYADQRKRLQNPGDFFSPGRSNLTLTGQMLNSMDFKVSGDTIEVFIPDSSRSPAVFQSKRKRNGSTYRYESGNNKTNAEIARLVAQERPFMALSSDEIRIVEQELQDILDEITRKL